MSENNILLQAFKHYDESKIKYKDFYKSIYKIESIDDNSSDLKLPIFKFKNNNIDVAKGSYNVLGVYDKDERVWIWGWALWFDVRNKTYLTRQIMNYAFDINTQMKENDNRSHVLNLMLHDKLISKTINISHPVELEQLLALSLYITKSDMIYRIDEDNLQYYMLLQDVKSL